MKVQQIELLKSIPNIQERIDLVAADLKKKRHKFSKIEVWDLAELLGVDFYDHADCPKTYFNYKNSLENAGYEYPFCEQIELLKGLVPQERYYSLESLANKIIFDELGDKDDSWLGLSAEEEKVIAEEYMRIHTTDSAMELAQFSLNASDGSELIFEVCIGDGGSLFDPLGPYDFKKGKTQDLSNFCEVDN